MVDCKNVMYRSDTGLSQKPQRFRTHPGVQVVGKIRDKSRLHIAIQCQVERGAGKIKDKKFLFLIQHFVKFNPKLRPLFSFHYK